MKVCEELSREELPSPVPTLTPYRMSALAEALPTLKPQVLFQEDNGCSNNPEEHDLQSWVCLSIMIS